ncbi:hypothetical protein, partial [[Mycobacterium] zoologicum]|uniref:hypothetical protein n=1 Tax=[Mycobacterium] zoologicum TaxID=2872311 RepID=UPI002BB75857
KFVKKTDPTGANSGDHTQIYAYPAMPAANRAVTIHRSARSSITKQVVVTWRTLRVAPTPAKVLLV